MAITSRNTTVAPTHHNNMKAGRGWLKRKDENVMGVHVITTACIKIGNHQKTFKLIREIIPRSGDVGQLGDCLSAQSSGFDPPELHEIGYNAILLQF